MNSTNTRRDLVMWLWQAHNEVCTFDHSGDILWLLYSKCFCSSCAFFSTIFNIELVLPGREMSLLQFLCISFLLLAGVLKLNGKIWKSCFSVLHKREGSVLNCSSMVKDKNIRFVK